jgi:D-alanyl-D-alanine carboxypeptidase
MPLSYTSTAGQGTASGPRSAQARRKAAHIPPCWGGVLSTIYGNGGPTLLGRAAACLSAVDGRMRRVRQALGIFGAAVTVWLTCVGCVALSVGVTPAAASDKNAAMVIDANNGSVMHAEQADELRFPASLTKVMTLYMAFEAIEQGRVSYNSRLKVSQEAASAPPTRIDLEPGETITLIDAMKALITKSANDAAVVIAEHLGGTEARFARMMTEKARLFGMSRTTFRNASGLPDPQQVTTARDMLRLALRIQDDFPRHYHLFATRSFTYEGTTFRNHNNLLHRFQGTDGLKTGYTRASGFNLVASVRRGGRHVIGVVMGGSTAARRDDKMQLLLSRALMTSSPYKTRRSAPVLIAAPSQRPRPVAQPVPAGAYPSAALPPRYALAGAGSAAETAAAAGPRPRSESRPAQSPADIRPVMVPPRPSSATPRSDAEPGWPREVPAPVPAVRPQMARSTSAPEPMQRLALAPRGLDDGRSQLGSGLAPIPRADPGRGMAPSTFEAQAARLAQESAAPVPAARSGSQPAPFRSPEPPASTARVQSGGGYEVQIGAYATAAEAERALAVARNAGGNLLGGQQSRVVPVAKAARQMYRARFVGFDSSAAASTCIELRRRQVDCFVMRAE